MAKQTKNSTLGLKIFFAGVSLTGIMGLWAVFSAQTVSGNVDPTPESVLSGELFLPELPTLSAPITIDPANLAAAQADAAQSLRSASAPPQTQITQPPLRVEQIIVGNSSGNTGSSSGGGSAPAPSTSTKSSR